jgi:ER degradation enhancer, mannosidase alpha-like 2
VNRLPLLLVLLPACSSPAPREQPAPVPAAQLAARVRAEFLHAWKGYRQHAWGHDALRPLSRGHHDWYAAPLLMTPVDGLDTMLLMGLRDEAKAATELIATRLSFDRDMSVRTFEITIRLLGGLLSAYQIGGDERLLRLAEDLGRRLLPAFASPTGMPYVFVNLRTGAVRQPVSNPAEVGTLLLEFGTLSQLTGKPEFRDRAMRALRAVYARRSKLGLVGAAIDVESGRWTDPESHLGGAIDSYYEYLYKCTLLFDDPECAAMWKESLAAANRWLADGDRAGLRRSAPPHPGLWYRHASMADGRPISTRFGALECFFPGLLAFSGDLERGKALQESCYRMWSLTGIIPESIDYSSMKIVDPRYVLRPEIVESTYYLYRATRDERYRRMGQVMFEDLVRYCRTDTGYASLADVVSKRKADEMESFFFAETLKYFYLLFSPPELLDPRQSVLNTEAHPLRRVAGRGR